MESMRAFASAACARPRTRTRRVAATHRAIAARGAALPRRSATRAQSPPPAAAAAPPCPTAAANSRRLHACLDLILGQSFGRGWKASLSAKNVLNPAAEETYTYRGRDYLRSSRVRGITTSFGVTYSF